MFSKRKLVSTILTASALFLSTMPVSAALRSKSSYTRVRVHSTAHLARLSFSTRTSATHVVAHSSAKPVQAHISKPHFHGQQAIDSTRTLEIQQALIREHYLQGDASGEWDQATREALIRFQDDNHWQTKVLPDARALIKLGLGPSQQNLLNPESAAIAMPPNQSGLNRPAQSDAN